MSLELKVAICDDEKYYREYLQKFIMDYFENKNIKVVSSLFSNGSEFCADKSNFQKYDIIFLDIEMDEMNGMDTAYMIRKFNLEVQIVFITIRVE
ncbi:MAG: LytR/AlgR family response regulator transcription factor [Eubacterium sp.]